MYEDDIELDAVQALVATVFQAATQDSSKTRAGRAPGSRTVKRGKCTCFDDYLSANPVHSPRKFREVFRIPLKLYRVLHDGLVVEQPLLPQ